MAIINFIATPNQDFTKILLYDKSTYPAGSGSNVDIGLVQSLNVYFPGDTNPTVDSLDIGTFISNNVASPYSNPDVRNPLEISIPSGKNGVVKLEVTYDWTDTLANPDIHYSGTFTLYTIIYKDALACIVPKIGSLALVKECGCEEDNSELFAMYLQLESAMFNMGCGKYIAAQNNIDTLINYCTNCGCGC